MASGPKPALSRKPRVQLDREGLIWTGIAAVMLLTGMLKSINLLALFACFMLVTIIWNLWAARRQVRNLGVSRQLDGLSFAGQPIHLVVEVKNLSRGLKNGLRLSDKGLFHLLQWLVIGLTGKTTQILHGEVILPRRGPYVWSPVLVTSGFPLGLITYQAHLGEKMETLVFPRVGHLQRGKLRAFLTMASPYAGHVRGPARRMPSAQADFHGLRPFRPGDSPRWIHWRTSARRGDLMVREFEEHPSDDLVLILDLFATPLPDCAEMNRSVKGEQVERALSLAATICWEWCRQKGDRLLLAIAGNPVSVIGGITGRELVLRLLESLAVQSPPSESPYPALLNLLGNASLPPGPVLLVTLGPSPLEGFFRQTIHRPPAILDLSLEADLELFDLGKPLKGESVGELGSGYSGPERQEKSPIEKVPLV